jgi:hypothetical protein
MRVLTVATVLLLSTSLVPSFAQDEGKSSPSRQPQTVPVQPERSPQQSEQSREQDREGGEDVRVGRDWRAQERDGDRPGRTGQNNDTGPMRDKMGRDMDRDHRTVGRNWRMRPDDDRADRDGYGRGSYNEDLPRRRVRVCFEYENGDEYCRYR